MASWSVERVWPCEVTCLGGRTGLSGEAARAIGPWHLWMLLEETRLSHTPAAPSSYAHLLSPISGQGTWPGGEATEEGQLRCTLEAHSTL